MSKFVLSWTMTAHCIATEKSSSLEMVAGMCSGHTSNVEKQVAATIHNRHRMLVRDVSSSVESNCPLISSIHRYVTARASRSSVHACKAISGSVVEVKRRLEIRACGQMKGSHVPIVRTVTSSCQLACIELRSEPSPRNRASPKLEMSRSTCHSRAPFDKGPSCQAA
jgi:hypothetical protein